MNLDDIIRNTDITLPNLQTDNNLRFAKESGEIIEKSFQKLNEKARENVEDIIEKNEQLNMTVSLTHSSECTAIPE